MLKINKMNVNIGLIEILKDVSLELDKGQMVGLIGRNGAGKTTLLRAIMGILPTKSGELVFEEGIEIIPKTNRLVMFKQGLEHRVRTFKGHRVSIAVNPWSTKLYK